MEEIDGDYLFRLAREKSSSGRRALADTISDLFSEQGRVLTERERSLMHEILRQLVHDTEVAAREIISSRLADLPNAPVDLIEQLANDEFEVAFPILTRSKVLRDEHLIEVVRNRTLEYKLAVANRRDISESVSDALVESSNESVVRTLLENSSANISQATMGYLVEQSQRVDTFQEPILRREDLDPTLAKKMFLWVSAALRRFILKNYELSQDEVDDLLEQAIQEDEQGGGGSHEDDSKSDILLSQLEEQGAVTPEFLAGALRDGEVRLFLSGFRRLTGLRELLIMRMLNESGGEGLAIVCRALGLEEDIFRTIVQHSSKVLSRGFRLESEIDAMMGFYRHIPQPAAEEVLHRWQRDVDYLAAIRELDLG